MCVLCQWCFNDVYVSAAAKARMDEVVYRRARHVISENQRCIDAADALKSADYVRFGQLMTASHNSLRSLVTTDSFPRTVGNLDWLSNATYTLSIVTSTS